MAVAAVCKLCLGVPFYGKHVLQAWIVRSMNQGSRHVQWPLFKLKS